jgi:5-methylcytosine-specific restriction protein A
MYNTSQWLALRQIQLSKHPLCAGCEADNIVNAATVVDHIFPWKQINKEAFFINKFQSLCYDHHAEKTQLEQRGIYRRYGKPSVDLSRLDYMTLMS